MTDRNVQFPNRFEIVAVPGTTNIFDVTPAPGEVYEEGTFWNKANVLKDATAALYGKGSSASPDEIFAAIRPLITEAKDSVNVASGSYVGANGTTKLTFYFNPKIFVVTGMDGSNYPNVGIAVNQDQLYVIRISGAGGSGTVTVGGGNIVGNTVNITFYNLNSSKKTYYYTAIG